MVELVIAYRLTTLRSGHRLYITASGEKAFLSREVFNKLVVKGNDSAVLVGTIEGSDAKYAYPNFLPLSQGSLVEEISTKIKKLGEVGFNTKWLKRWNKRKQSFSRHKALALCLAAWTDGGPYDQLLREWDVDGNPLRTNSIRFAHQLLKDMDPRGKQKPVAV